MSVIRVNKNKNYTSMSNHHLRNKDLSLKGKGLLSVMLSLPDDWNYTVEGLMSILKENETAINNSLKELKELGYLEVTKLMPNQTKSGRIEYVYDIFETPKQEGKKQDLENLGLEFLGVENQGQINTNILNNNNNNNNININNTKEEKENTKENKSLDEVEKMFNDFWKAYPRKDSKKTAFTKFKNIKKLKDEFENIMKALEIFKKSEQWKNPQYIPMPSTWLNQERWKDESIIKTINNNDRFKNYKFNEI